MSQRKYALDILQDTGLTGARPDKLPMEQYLKLIPDDGELLKDPVKYRRLVGRLIYLTVTRPDIAFSVLLLSHGSKKKQTNVSRSSAEAEYLFGDSLVAISVAGFKGVM